MNTDSRSAQEAPVEHLLTIGDLADRTGLSPATLRMWEQRHDFPQPHRLASGHRRYRESDVATVERVVRRRDAGVRLDVAIADALSRATPGTPSVYAELRRKHPHLPVQRLHKGTLLALSWAIEDEFCAKAERAVLFGAFQRERFYAASRPRWHELSVVARASFVFADFPDLDRPRAQTTATGPSPVLVPLAAEEPMAREWAVVCDDTDLPVVLTAWELPGQIDVPDGQRVFESMLSVDPLPVRDAARVCATVAQRAGAEDAIPTLYHLGDKPAPTAMDPAAVSAMFGRVLSYVDHFSAP